MPTIPINNESPSVFDPLFEQVMKRLGGGSAPDASDIAGLMGPLGVPAGLISKIPLTDKMLPKIRNMILKEHLADNKVPEIVMNPVNFAVNRYPRLMSHLADVKTVEKIPSDPGYVIKGQHLAYKNPSGGYTSGIEIARDALKHKDLPADQAVADTFGHELTHAAQNLWNSKKFIKGTNSGPTGNKTEYLEYFNSPYEVGARKAGDNFRRKMYDPASIRKLKKGPEPVARPEPSVIDKLLGYITGE